MQHSTHDATSPVTPAAGSTNHRSAIVLVDNPIAPGALPAEPVTDEERHEEHGEPLNENAPVDAEPTNIEADFRKRATIMIGSTVLIGFAATRGARRFPTLEPVANVFYMILFVARVIFLRGMVNTVLLMISPVVRWFIRREGSGEIMLRSYDKMHTRRINEVTKDLPGFDVLSGKITSGRSDEVNQLNKVLYLPKQSEYERHLNTLLFKEFGINVGRRGQPREKPKEIPVGDLWGFYAKQACGVPWPRWHFFDSSFVIEIERSKYLHASVSNDDH